MDKCKEIKNEIFKIVYGCVCDVVPLPEKIIIDPRYTSRTLDGCTSESGAVYKNDDKWFSVFIKYGSYCVCMVRLEANTLKPIQLEVMKPERTKSGRHDIERIKISAISEIKDHAEKMCSFLKAVIG